MAMAMARRPTRARPVALAPLTVPLTARSTPVRRMAWPTRSPRFRSRAPGEDRSTSLPGWVSRSARARPSLRRGSRRPKEPSRPPWRDRRDGDELEGAAPSSRGAEPLERDGRRRAVAHVRLARTMGRVDRQGDRRPRRVGRNATARFGARSGPAFEEQGVETAGQPDAPEHEADREERSRHIRCGR